MVKEVVWRNVGVDLARTVVDLLLNLLEPFLRDGSEVISFGEILPDKPVVVLHTALFPGMVGFAEIALAFQQLANCESPLTSRLFGRLFAEFLSGRSTRNTALIRLILFHAPDSVNETGFEHHRRDAFSSRGTRMPSSCCDRSLVTTA